MKNIPRYKDLPEFKELDSRHAWDVFGRDDQLGRVNLMTADAVVAAAAEVKRGARFNLSLPLTDPEPSWSKNRKNLKHVIFSANRKADQPNGPSVAMCTTSGRWRVQSRFKMAVEGMPNFTSL